MKSHRDFVGGLLGQAILNDGRLDQYAEDFGRSMAVPPKYVDLLSGLARTPVRLILGTLLEEPSIKEALDRQKYAVMRQATTFDRAMRIANSRYGWVRRALA